MQSQVNFKQNSLNKFFQVYKENKNNQKFL